MNQSGIVHTYTHPLVSCGDRAVGTGSIMNQQPPLHFEWNRDRVETTPDETEGCSRPGIRFTQPSQNNTYKPAAPYKGAHDTFTRRMNPTSYNSSRNTVTTLSGSFPSSELTKTRLTIGLTEQ